MSAAGRLPLLRRLAPALALAFTLGGGGPARAGALEQGKLYLQGAAGVPADLPRAYANFDSAARRGDPAGAYYLGLMYKNGLGVGRDSQAAARNFEMAARGGVAQAMFILANMLLSGDGVARDVAAARRWIDAADELGYPEAAMAKAMGLREGSMGYAHDDEAAALQMKVAEHAMTHRPAAP